MTSEDNDRDHRYGAMGLTLSAAAAALRDGTSTSRALTEVAIANADATDELLGTYLARFDEAALAAADRADAELASGLDRGPLHGIPFAVKDIIAVADGPTTAQSLVLDPAWAAGRDAPVVARLRAAGAVITGKTSTMEFAVGMPDTTKPFRLPRNPWNPGTWAGGSSSGSGAGVAAGTFLGALGTDTAGGIRIPAAFCGVSGLVPTFGRVPKTGVVPLGFSLDHVGTIARAARDCAEVLAVIAGAHPSDPDSADAPFAAPERLWSGDLAGLRIGVLREGHFPPETDPAVPGAFGSALDVLAALGADLAEVTLPYWAEMHTVNMVTMCGEAVAYHRNDLANRWHDYFAPTRQLLAFGALMSGADYVQAQRVRRAAQDAVRRLFARFDVLVGPLSSVPAPRYLDEHANVDLADISAVVHTEYWDSLATPILAVPMGSTADGMPLSLQLVARAFDEATLLRVGDAFQRRTDWHLRTPRSVLTATA
jgi:aspartyl-tRNA(Asn)/glutamyl-tRNA(Gln) amidotransferase subunit A